MVNDRDRDGSGTEPNAHGLTYWVTNTHPSSKIDKWQRVTPNKFRALLAAASDSFPKLPPGQSKDQRHVTILVPGNRPSSKDSADVYEEVCDRLFDGPDGLGLCILYDWPSVPGYGLNRERARRCGEDLAIILCQLFDWTLVRQGPCKAKLSVIAHGMGNYVLQKAMAIAWERKNQQPHANLFDELVMVAADVDNDLFDVGAPDKGDADSMINLSYRITVLYSVRDGILKDSAKLKRFGTQARLGHSGLANRPPVVNAGSNSPNVWDVDCSSFFPASVSEPDIHGAYFQTDAVLFLMRGILRGLDRQFLQPLGITTGNAWPPAGVPVPSAPVEQRTPQLVQTRDDGSRLLQSHQEEQRPLTESTSPTREIFLCHASEDKAAVAKPLSEALTKAGISNWYDAAELGWGDSITQKINEGLSKARYVIVVLSTNFLKKNWPQRELNAAISREAASGQVVVLPLVVGNAQDEQTIFDAYPLLRDKLYLKWNEGVESLIAILQARLKEA